jgi:phosphohistidine phosphatase SixA
VSVVLLRHAWAGDRKHWDGDDLLRPLDARGRRQAFALRGLDVDRIVSSRYVRCIETVEQLAATRALGIEVDARLAEGAGRSAVALLAELDGGVACTHGDVIHDLLGRGLEKGAAAIVEVVGDVLRVVELLDAP